MPELAEKAEKRIRERDGICLMVPKAVSASQLRIIL